MAAQVGFNPFLQSQSEQGQYRYSDLPPDQALEERALARKQQIANLLMTQGLQHTQPQGQMIGRFYVKPDWSQNIAGLGEILAGAVGSHMLGKQEQESTDKYRTLQSQAIQDYVQKMQGEPAHAPEPGSEGPTLPAQAPTPQTKYAAIAQALGSQQPGLHQLALHDYTQLVKPPDKPIQVDTGGGTTFLDPLTLQPKATIPSTVSPNTQATIASQQQVHATPSGNAVLEDTTKRELFPQVSGNAAAAAAGQGAIALQAHQDRQAQMDQNKRQDEATLEMRKAQGLSEQDYKQAHAALEDKWHAQATQMERERLAIQKEVTQQGKVPPGYEKIDGGLKAIPGGPADVKKEGILNQDTAILSQSTSNLDRLATAANEVMQHPGLGGITGLRGAIPNIPGSAAADAQAKLATLKSQVGFGVLQDMRNNSKTGGALGQVSDAEGKRLEANLAALDNAQSETQMKESLRKVIDYAGAAKDRLHEAFNLKHKAGEGTPPKPAASGLTPDEQKELESLKKKYGR